ncbi:MAG: PPC domain-containing DNA-binding protein [Candidatus Hodarchaeales archaeon]|jgi:predicted DNA-binding protein with PD1-like motif
MQFKQKDDTFILRLDKGETIIETLQKFLEEKEINGGFFTGLGAVNQIILRYFDQNENKYYEKTFNEDLEVTSLIGNITMFQGKPAIHSHIVLGNKEFQSISGHFTEGTVGATLEVILIKREFGVIRKLNENLGLNLLHFNS